MVDDTDKNSSSEIDAGENVVPSWYRRLQLDPETKEVILPPGRNSASMRSSVVVDNPTQSSNDNQQIQQDPIEPAVSRTSIAPSQAEISRESERESVAPAKEDRHDIEQKSKGRLKQLAKAVGLYQLGTWLKVTATMKWRQHGDREGLAANQAYIQLMAGNPSLGVSGLKAEIESLEKLPGQYNPLNDPTAFLQAMRQPPSDFHEAYPIFSGLLKVKDLLLKIGEIDSRGKVDQTTLPAEVQRAMDQAKERGNVVVQAGRSFHQWAEVSEPNTLWSVTPASPEDMDKVKPFSEDVIGQIEQVITGLRDVLTPVYEHAKGFDSSMLDAEEIKDPVPHLSTENAQRLIATLVPLHLQLAEAIRDLDGVAKCATNDNAPDVLQKLIDEAFKPDGSLKKLKDVFTSVADMPTAGEEGRYIGKAVGLANTFKGKMDDGGVWSREALCGTGAKSLNVTELHLCIKAAKTLVDSLELNARLSMFALTLSDTSRILQRVATQSQQVLNATAVERIDEGAGREIRTLTASLIGMMPSELEKISKIPREIWPPEILKQSGQIQRKHSNLIDKKKKKLDSVQLEPKERRKLKAAIKAIPSYLKTIEKIAPALSPFVIGEIRADAEQKRKAAEAAATSVSGDKIEPLMTKAIKPEDIPSSNTEFEKISVPITERRKWHKWPMKEGTYLVQEPGKDGISLTIIKKMAKDGSPKEGKPRIIQCPPSHGFKGGDLLKIAKVNGSLTIDGIKRGLKPVSRSNSHKL